jgi:hypothetical protein
VRSASSRKIVNPSTVAKIGIDCILAPRSAQAIAGGVTF